MIKTIPPVAPMMIGWSKGIALQFSLPSRFIFPPSLTWITAAHRVVGLHFGHPDAATDQAQPNDR